jgi:hypothetical protein
MALSGVYGCPGARSGVRRPDLEIRLPSTNGKSL